MMGVDMKMITTHADNGTTTLQLEGEIDLHVSPELRETLRTLAATETDTLLIDFSGVSYVDSSGLATLVEYARLSNDYGGKMALFGLQSKVRMVFDLVRLDELFTIADDADSAVKLVKARGSKVAR